MMIRIAQQVSRAIRILRGNRDESARASHLVVKKDLLMTYESALIGQAEREKCSQSTFSERKIMSTKTSIKRIAAVAAVALTLGGFSAVSAHAVAGADATPFYVSVADSGVQTAVSATASAKSVAGANNYVQLRAGTGLSALAANTTLSITVSGAGASIGTVTPGAGSAWTLNNANAAAGTLATAVTTPVALASASLVGSTVNILTPTVGTVTAVVASNLANTATGVTTTTTLQTFTITVNAASVAGTFSLSNSKAYITDSATVVGYGTTATTGNFDTAAGLLAADATVLADKGTAGTPALVADIVVTINDTNGAGTVIS